MTTLAGLGFFVFAIVFIAVFWLISVLLPKTSNLAWVWLLLVVVDKFNPGLGFVRALGDTNRASSTPAFIVFTIILMVTATFVCLVWDILLISKRAKQKKLFASAIKG